MYCSIQEAFETSTPAQAPKKPKRRRVERFTPDPDRPANAPAPSIEKVGGGSTSYSNLLTAIDADQSYFPNPSEDSTENTYMLEPDWTKQFDGPSVPPWIKERIAAKEAEVPLKPTWMDGEATLWQKIPAAYAAPTAATASHSQSPSASAFDATTPFPSDTLYSDLDDRFHQFESKIESKLDKMFAKLSELDARKSESNHIEIILFIIGGLFVVLMLDILVKQGTKASLMLAAAGAPIGGALRQFM
jgi:hypothetical protein